MTPRRSWAASLVTVLFMTASFDAAFAQSTAPGAIVVTEEVVVQGRLIPEEEVAEERLDAIPGGTGLVAAGDLAGKANLNISDALASTPGVIVQNFFGGNDQPRVQIRGSGLQQNPVERGVLVLQNGLPMNRADGSYIVGLTDARQAQFAEVYRGYTANRLGATVLGGALNFVSPTGSSAPGFAATFEGGSFGLRSGSVQAGGDTGDLDGLVQVSFSQRDGFRERNESSRLSFDANIGGELSDTVSTRLFVGYTDLGFDVVGPLTAEEYERDPRQIHPGPTVRPNPSPPPGLLVSNPGPNVGRDQPQREVDQFRLVSRTTATAGSQLVDAVLGYSYTDDAFRFPIPAGIRETIRGGLLVRASLRLQPGSGSSVAAVRVHGQVRRRIGRPEQLHEPGRNAGAVVRPQRPRGQHVVAACRAELARQRRGHGLSRRRLRPSATRQYRHVRQPPASDHRVQPDEPAATVAGRRGTGRRYELLSDL